MVWPTASIPTYGRGVWLECNGQSFSRTQFPQLYETLGTTRVPDYQGMFLRGYGSQTYSQNNGEHVGTTSTTYSSGTFGNIQGDATRPYETVFYSEEGLAGVTSSSFPDLIIGMYPCIKYVELYGNGLNSDPAGIGDPYPPPYAYSTPSTNLLEGYGKGFYTYDLTYSTSTDSEGNEHIDSIELVPTWHDEVTLTLRSWWIHMSNEMTSPTDNEIRPVNVAVKFMIKAK